MLYAVLTQVDFHLPLAAEKWLITAIPVGEKPLYDVSLGLSTSHILLTVTHNPRDRLPLSIVSFYMSFLSNDYHYQQLALYSTPYSFPPAT
jgi:hypothetical protein